MACARQAATSAAPNRVDTRAGFYEYNPEWSYPVSVDSSRLVSWVTPKCLVSYSIGEL
jgi:hypothetical protein